MTAEAQPLSNPSRSHPPRKLRNYLLQPKFQLKYTSMVVGVTVVVAAVLGFQAYSYSTGQTELLNIERMEAKGGAVDERFIADLDNYAREADRKVLLAVLGGIAVARIRPRHHRHRGHAPPGRPRVPLEEAAAEGERGTAARGRQAAQARRTAGRVRGLRADGQESPRSARRRAARARRSDQPRPCCGRPGRTRIAQLRSVRARIQTSLD